MQSALCMGLFLELHSILDGGSEDTTKEVNQGSDLDLLASLVMSGVCLSIRVKKKVQCCKQSTVSIQRAFGGSVVSRDDIRN